MTIEELLTESTKGGPGLCGYTYDADMFCVHCAEDIMRQLAPALAPTLRSTDDPEFRDSDIWPQPIFFGESDVEEHCGDCGEYLYGDNESVTDEERANGPRRGETGERVGGPDGLRGDGPTARQRPQRLRAP